MNAEAEREAMQDPPDRGGGLRPRRVAHPATGYILALAVMAVALLVRIPLWPVLDGKRPYLTLFGGVAVVIWFTRWKPAVFAAVVGFLAANYFIAEPQSGIVFDEFFVIEFIVYAFSAGFIIFFGESLHRARDDIWGDRELQRNTLSSIGDGVIVTDAQGRVASLNREAEKLTGWRAADARGKPLAEVFHIVNEQTGKSVENPVEKAIRLGTVVGLANHTILISKQGVRTPIDDSAAPISEKGGPIRGVVLVFRDVTEQRAAHRAKARLAAIVEHSGDAIITKDINGIVQTWNAAAEQLFGYTPEEIIGKPITLLVPPDRAQEETTILSRLRRGEPSERLDTVRLKKDGTPVHVAVTVSPLKDSYGEVIGASKVIRDISDLVAAREALVREKERLGTTLASIGDGVIATDAEARITSLNAVAEDITGWSEHDAIGQPLDVVFRIVNEDTRKAVENPAVRALREGVIVGLANHTVLIRKDGAERPIDDSAAPIRDGNGGTIGCVLVFRDITERRQAERQVADSRAHLAAILDQLPVGVGVMDLLGKWTLSNPVMNLYVPKAIPSTVPEQSRRWRAWDAEGNVIAPQNWPGQRALRGDIVAGLEMLYLADDGREMWMQVSSAPLRDSAQKVIGATCVVQNIDEAKRFRTERERLQDELAVKARELEVILDTAPVQIWFGDADCKAFHGNRYAYEEHRLPRGINASFTAPAVELPAGLRLEVNGRPLLPEEMPMQLVARTGNALTRFEHDVIHVDGTRQTMLANVSPILNPDGSVRRIVGVYIDITERKRAEQEKIRLLESERHARSEAEHAARSKDEFLATLSHELRNPLNAILGWSRLIEQNPNDTKSVNEGIRVISRNAKVQADLIADLLDMSRIVSGKLRLEPEALDLPELVRSSVESVRHAAEAKGIDLETDVVRMKGPFLGDSSRLQQVVWNLLSNAVKFTPKDGRIRVSLTEKGSHVEIVVSDTGAGIDPEFLPHVFGRFKQADVSAARQHGGLGLGLAIIKHIVELHGGTVRAESPGKDKGATFVVQLPLRSRAAVSPDDSHSPPEVRLGACDDYDLTGIRVLAIDDQHDTQTLIARLLEECHADVALASSADEGLETLREYRPHVVLCDIGMPGKDGYEFIREMRQLSNTPALAVTAFARTEDKLRALRSGYQGHIPKPIDPSELIASVAVLVKRLPYENREARP